MFNKEIMILKKLYPSRRALILLTTYHRTVKLKKENQWIWSGLLSMAVVHIFLFPVKDMGEKDPSLSLSLLSFFYPTQQLIVRGPFFRAFFSSLQMIHFWKSIQSRVKSIFVHTREKTWCWTHTTRWTFSILLFHSRQSLQLFLCCKKSLTK